MQVVQLLVGQEIEILGHLASSLTLEPWHVHPEGQGVDQCLLDHQEDAQHDAAPATDHDHLLLRLRTHGPGSLVSWSLHWSGPGCGSSLTDYDRWLEPWLQEFRAPV